VSTTRRQNMLRSNLCSTHLWLPHWPISSQLETGGCCGSRLGAGNRPTTHHSTAAVLLQAGSSRQRWYTKSPFISAGCSIAHVRGFNADNALWFSNEPEVSGPSPASSPAHHGTRALISVLVPQDHRHLGCGDRFQTHRRVGAITSEDVLESQPKLPGIRISCNLLLISL
jgi:hypothetical protein